MRKVLLALFVMLVALVGADLALGPLAEERVVDALYYQAVRPEAHRVSEDPLLHYELQPGEHEAWSVNALGARGPAPTEGSRRVAVFGGSTIWGAGLADHETLPARLQEELGGGCEVLNFGISAYVHAQATRLARRQLDLPGLELVVVVPTNTGRRAFLDGAPVDLAWFDEDPRKWLENLYRDEPFALGGRRLEHTLLVTSRAYRIWAATHLPRSRTNLDPNPWTYALWLEEAAALEAEAAEAGVEVVWVGWPMGRQGPTALPEGFGGVKLQLWQPNRGQDWYELHPGAETMAGQAALLARMMGEAGVVCAGEVGTEDRGLGDPGLRD